MTNKEKLQAHNAELQELIGVAEALPDAKAEPILQKKSVTPTKAVQAVRAEVGYDGLSEVTVKAIPDEYIIPSGSGTFTENGEYDVKELETAVVNVEGSGGGGDSEMLTALIEGTLEELRYEKATVVRQSLFEGNTKIKRAYLPNVVELEDSAFYRAELLELAYIPNLETIGGSALRKCSIGELNFPKLKIIPSYAFEASTRVKSANFENVTTIKTKGLYSCGSNASITDGLNKLDFPVLTDIGGSAFGNCTRLTTLIIRINTICTMQDVTALMGTPIASGTGYIYVPASLVDSYKAATNWSAYAAQIRAIEDYPDITGG